MSGSILPSSRFSVFWGRSLPLDGPVLLRPPDIVLPSSSALALQRVRVCAGAVPRFGRECGSWAFIRAFNGARVALSSLAFPVAPPSRRFEASEDVVGVLFSLSSR